MLEIREIKCPNCDAPADADAGTCAYCYAKISQPGEGGVGPVVLAIVAASVIGLFAADWFLGTGLTDWIAEACRRLAAGAPKP